MILESRKIVTNYFENKFLFHILSLFGFITGYYEELNSFYIYTRFLIYMRFIQFNDLSQILRSRILFIFKVIKLDCIILRGYKKHVSDLVKLIIFVMVYCHFGSCVYYGLGKIEVIYLDYEENWL